MKYIMFFGFLILMGCQSSPRYVQEWQLENHFYSYCRERASEKKDMTQITKCMRDFMYLDKEY